MVSRSGFPIAELVAYLNEYLDAFRGRDYGPTGLQIEDREEIRKVVTGVSSCHKLFVRAREAPTQSSTTNRLPSATQHSVPKLLYLLSESWL
ncbi:MAG TPA: hypothetical protein VGS07_00280 [Thermoanaerobaculia bacterium]|nr:hypothetical protein [Thermoanaerobaculia bacterium]